MLLMKIGKRLLKEGLEQPNPESVRTFGEKENYIFLRILEADIIKPA